MNAFASQESPELRGKSIARIQGITALCAVLEKCLAGLIEISLVICYAQRLNKLLILFMLN